MNRIIKWSCLSIMIALSPALVGVLAHAEETAAASEQGQFSEAELAQMLAPIALYPDSLLTHILIAATYPLEIVEAQRWLNNHPGLSTKQLMAKAEDQDWDPSVVALLAFPNVLKQMNDDLDWTQKLGDAFLQDEAGVLASIQSLRRDADAANSLADMDNMKIKRVEQQIIIEPVQPQIVYVPYYDPWIVYGHWRWIGYPPVYWDLYPYYTRHGHFYWHTGIYISFNYFFSAFNWPHHHIIVTQPRGSYHYRSRQVIAHSHGVQRWHHQPHHRRGVAYRNDNLRHKYHSNRPSMLRSDSLGHRPQQSINRSKQVQTLKGMENFPAYQRSDRLHQPRDKVFIDKLRGNDYRAKVRGDVHKDKHQAAHGQRGLSGPMSKTTPTWKREQGAKFKGQHDVTASKPTWVKPQNRGNRDWGHKVNRSSVNKSSAVSHNRVNQASNNSRSHYQQNNHGHSQARPETGRAHAGGKHHSSDDRRMEQRK
ncbi:DUF3300 domain-containing protein [Shewanella sp. AS16]|uniref:DUF3300 domain-containing protein n=1 Tax=Shewanella sp. AS16 TaxID=2907625 RepID=UPI001F460DD2|nr:DUF3300 domain-containing protein [Shewanella sp. AS16]MCE9685255.1 DUF3300 domain-containing protein [Shewanella sp. AS16]